MMGALLHPPAQEVPDGVGAYTGPGAGWSSTVAYITRTLPYLVVASGGSSTNNE
jgi:hypothetical protein